MTELNYNQTCPVCGAYLRWDGDMGWVCRRRFDKQHQAARKRQEVAMREYKRSVLDKIKKAETE